LSVTGGRRFNSLALNRINLTSWTFIVLSGLGIIVAIYHAYSELTESFQYCTLNAQVSCQGVFESGYTSLFGVPFYVLGLVWFPLSLLLGVVTIMRGQNGVSGSLLLPFLLIGDIFTVYLWYLELGVIGIICPVCVTLYAINYALTGVAAKSLL
jgi:uncharacterized membrane protein